MKDIFVVALDPFHLELLRTIRGAEECEFHPLVDRPPDGFAPSDRMLADARRQLDGEAA